MRMQGNQPSDKAAPLRLPQEKRGDSRVNEEDKVQVEVLSKENPTAGTGTPPINALTKDISPGGVRIISGVKLEAGTRVRLEIVLSGRRRLIKMTGVVRWARSVYEEDLFEMGIEFVGLTPEDRLNLIEHVYKKRD
jgi:c-di-GMP-binding flagellar brake protein YcgR